MCVPREQEEWPGGSPKSPAEIAKSMDVFDWTTGLSLRQVERPVRALDAKRPAAPQRVDGACRPSGADMAQKSNSVISGIWSDGRSQLRVG